MLLQEVINKRGSINSLFYFIHIKEECNMKDARETVTLLCNKIEIMNTLCNMYMMTVDLQMSGSSQELEDKLNEVMDDVEEFVTGINTEEIISQYPEPDQKGLVDYLGSVINVIKGNRNYISSYRSAVMTDKLLDHQ
jgi:hypothetical protein